MNTHTSNQDEQMHREERKLHAFNGLFRFLDARLQGLLDFASFVPKADKD